MRFFSPCTHSLCFLQMAMMVRLLLDSHELWQMHRLWFERPQLGVYEALHFPFQENRARVATAGQCYRSPCDPVASFEASFPRAIGTIYGVLAQQDRHADVRWRRLALPAAPVVHEEVERRDRRRTSMHVHGIIEVAECRLEADQP